MTTPDQPPTQPNIPRQRTDDGTELVLYTKREAAELLRVKVSWLERRCARRQIPFSMLSGQYRFTPEHLTEIVRLNEQSTGAIPRLVEPRGRLSREVRQPPDTFVPLRPRPARRAS
jgi:hypothetical protein